MTERTFKYHRDDFLELPVALDHLDMYINFLPNYVESTIKLTITPKIALDRVELDAHDLDILSVEWIFSGAYECVESEYKREHNKLIVKLPKLLDASHQFVLRIMARCVPSDRILEGIYKDVTPPGAPQQYMSQCQQWGFQRIMPIFDDCRAKCTMTTILEGDARYTHLISNGDICRESNPDGRPVPKPGSPDRQIITFVNKTPMAPYLFIATAGTWDALEDSVTYDDGKTVRLEYLVPQGRAKNALIPMEILKQSVLWVNDTQDYEYTADTYRTICMTKSNFGGMENVGNTTIVTDSALIDEHTLDQTILYAHAVIVHEYEHNQCGSETTMATPFDVWLNEAYTVDVEHAFMQDVFDRGFVRLTQVDGIRSPLLGPLAIEDGGAAGRIVRDGFNNPDDLIDGVTYVKAAEVIRMLRLTIGEENFKAGKTLYFTRYKHSNADTDQFFECFEEVSGRSLEGFKKGWLYRIGYPKVKAVTSYSPESKQFHIDLTQDILPDGLPFEIPIELSLFDTKGREIPGTARTVIFTEPAERITLDDIPEAPGFASLNRDCSFYGVFQQDADFKALELQAKHDANAYNRVEAMRKLTDRERISLLKDPGRSISEAWLGLYGEFLNDPKLSPGLKAYFLRIEEQPLDRDFFTWFPELVAARKTLMKAVHDRYEDTLMAAFKNLDTYGPRDNPKDGIEERILKHTLLDLIAADDSPESHAMIIEHFNKATTAQDKVSALVILNRSSSPERRSLLEKVYNQWHTHLSGYANYLRIIGSGTCSDVFEMLDSEKRRPTFDINQPTWSRALFVPMAVNNEMVWTDAGIQWITDTIIELAKVNGYVASKLLNTFQSTKRLKPELKTKAQAALERIIAEVDPKTSATIHSQAKAYLP